MMKWLDCIRWYIPKSRQVVDPTQALVAEASKWLNVKEVNGVQGPEIKAFLANVGINFPAPWCAAFAMYCIDQVDKRLGLTSKIHKSPSVLAVWNGTMVEQRLTFPTGAIPGTLILWQHYDHNNKPTAEGHMGIVIAAPSPGVVTTIEGNTSSNDRVVDRIGDGVYQKTRHYPAQYPSMRVLGFLKIW